MRLWFALLLLLSQGFAVGAARPKFTPEEEWRRALAAAYRHYMSQLPDSLGLADRIELYALAPDKTREGQESWPATAFRSEKWLTERKTITGRAMKPWIASLRENCRRRTPNGVLCHEPQYGIRLWRRDTCLFYSTLCWDCGNFTIPMPDGVEGLYAFADVSTMALCEGLMPIPKPEPGAGGVVIVKPREPSPRMRLGDLPLHGCLPIQEGAHWTLEMLILSPEGGRRKVTFERQWKEAAEYQGRQYSLVETRKGGELEKTMVRRDGPNICSLDLTDMLHGEQVEVRLGAEPGATWPRWYRGVFFWDTLLDFETVKLDAQTYERCAHVRAEMPWGWCKEEYWVSPEVGLVKSVQDFSSGFRAITTLRQAGK